MTCKDHHQEEVASLLEHEDLERLTPWEQSFLRGLAAQEFPATDGQHIVLESIKLSLGY